MRRSLVEAYLVPLTGLRESGRRLSAASRATLASIRVQLGTLDYHPRAGDAIALIDELLAEPVAVTEALQTGDATPVEAESALFEIRFMTAMIDHHEAAIFMSRSAEQQATHPELRSLAAGIISGQSAEQEQLRTWLTEWYGISYAQPAMPEPMSESIHLWEAVDKGGRVWDVVLIEAGESLNGRYYPADVLRKAAPLFEGVFAYADHQDNGSRLSGQDRSIRDKVGRFSNVRFGTWTVGDRMVEGLRARFKVVAPWLREALVEAVSAGEPDFYGFSIDAQGEVETRAVGGKRQAYVKSIGRVSSVDVVSNPAAGGRIERLVASNPPGGSNPMKCKHCNAPFEAAEALVEHLTEAHTVSPETMAQAIQEALKPQSDGMAEIRAELIRERSKARLAEALAGATTLTDVSKGQIRKHLTALIEAGTELTEEVVTERITEATEHEAALAQRFNRPLSVGRVQAGSSQADNFGLALERMFDNPIEVSSYEDGIKPFSSLKEAFSKWEGRDPFDVNPREILAAMAVPYDSAVHHRRITESLATTGWGEVFADKLYVNMLRQFVASPLTQAWRMVVSEIENVPDFQTRHWVRIGGYGDLSTVNEQGTYPTATSPTDEEVTYVVQKRGLIDDVTFEAITNDAARNFGAIRKIPGGLARSAARTLYKFVLNLVTTTNPTLDYDTTALYDAAHSNTGTTALSLDGLNTTQVAMRAQTAYNESNEILGARNNIKILIVPAALEMLAKRLVNPSAIYNLSPTASSDTSIDPTSFVGQAIQVLAYDVLTDTNDYFAIADPREVNTMVVGFLGGQQEPELFVQDSPVIGGVFTSDKVSYKVRHIYGGDILDHRSFYRQVN